MAKTSVVIPCWIIDDVQLKLTQMCVESVRETSDAELILVDNGSKLGSDYLRDEADVYIRFPKNRGYVQAINSGFLVASNQYLVAGNNDFCMSSGWEEAQIEVLDNVKDAGIACLHVEGSHKHGGFIKEPGTPGGWWMIERGTLLKIGLLDGRFFNVFADYDYVWRMEDTTGLYVISTHKVTVRHHGEASLSRFDRRQEEYDRGKWLLLDKWKDSLNFNKHVGVLLEQSDIKRILEENAKYSKSIEYSS